MKRSIQAELWCRLTGDVGEYDALCEKCETPRIVEIERIYEDVCEKFEATINADQRKIFRKLTDLVFDIKYDYHEKGTALGFCLARELRTFLECPAEAMNQAVTTYTPITDQFRSAIALSKS